MRTIIVHIGLSKTATSSLQIDYFNKYDNQYWNYIGVRQPRSKLQHNIYEKLMNWTIYKQDGNMVKRDIRNEIENELKTEMTPLLISEEMLTVSSNGIDWEDKLKRLEAVLRGFDYLIIITVREPVEALFSYYVERFYALRSRFPTFISFFKYGNEANIYRYDYLHKFLIAIFGKQRIVYVPFESAHQNNYINLISEAMDLDLQIRDYPLPNRNRRKKTEKGVYAPSHQQDKWIGDIPPNKTLRNTLSAILGNIKNFFTLSSKEALVPYLTADEKKFCTNMLKPGNKYFKEVSGIDYI